MKNPGEKSTGRQETEDIEASEPQADSARNFGFAYSAAAALVGSVVVMLAFGWIADRALGTSPWGIAAGIILGAAIGLYEFIKISNRINT
ncbi:MAG TPA: AtpZ/AtpI family protein [Pyrinomonadaceae bacterium]|nr:AtpZ/AtpI family protein [Pyrinomonadaceae bacterium]